MRRRPAEPPPCEGTDAVAGLELVGEFRDDPDESAEDDDERHRERDHAAARQATHVVACMAGGVIPRAAAAFW